MMKIPSTSHLKKEIVSSWRGWMIWAAAALFYLYEFFVRVAPSAMAPELQQAFQLSAAGLGAAVGIYYTIYSPMQLLAGSFIDRFGAKAVLVPSALICTLGCFVEVMGASSFWLGVARFCQGLGSAFAFVGTMYLAAEWFPRSRLALLSGLTTSLGMAGAIIGNSGIAHVVEALGWQLSLWVAGGVGIVITFFILLIVPSKQKIVKEHLQEGVQALEMEKRLNIFQSLKLVYTNPHSWYAGIIGMALYMPLSILGALWGVDYIMAVSGTTKVGAAGAVSMLYVGWLVGGPIAGWFSDRMGNRRNLLLTASIATLLITLSIVFIPPIPLMGWYGLLLLLGLVSTPQVVCFVAAVEHNPPAVSGTALAATNMIIMLIGGIGEWVFGIILDHCASGVGDPNNYPIHAFRTAILILPAIAAFGVIAALLLTEGFYAKKK